MPAPDKRYLGQPVQKDGRFLVGEGGEAWDKEALLFLSLCQKPGKLDECVGVGGGCREELYLDLADLASAGRHQHMVCRLQGYLGLQLAVVCFQSSLGTCFHQLLEL